MLLPQLNVPESEKDQEWIKRVAKSIRQLSDADDLEVHKDKTCRNIYYGQVSQTDYDYLRKSGDYEYPAFVRNIPIIYPKLQALRGKNVERPLKYHVFTTDQENVNEKMQIKSRQFVDFIFTKIYDRYSNLINQGNQAKSFLEQYQQQQQGPANTDLEYGSPMGATLSEEQLRSSEIFIKLSEMGALAQQNEIEKLERTMSMSQKQLLEVWGNQGLKYLFDKQKLYHQFSEGLENKVTVDKEVYLVDVNNAYDDPRLEVVNTDFFWYMPDNSIDYIQDSMAYRYDKYMSLTQIIDNFRFELSPEDMTKLKNNRNFYSNPFPFPGGNSTSSDANCDDNGILYSSYGLQSMHRVSYIYFKSPRAVNWKKTENKYLPGEYNQHLVDEHEMVNKKNDETTMYETFYMNDIYECIIIDESTFIRARKKPIQLRHFDNWGKVSGPFFGLAYFSKWKRPHSMVWACKDIQMLYNLMHYFEELWYALSGTKGLVMDKSQKPDDMSDEEWFYQRKLGNVFIQTVKNGKQISSFNQFRTYDDTVGQGAQIIQATKEYLEGMIEKVTGINRFMQGLNSSDDLVGVTKNAVSQGTTMTAMVFYEHDLNRMMACEAMVNLCRYAWKNGKRDSYVDNYVQVMLNVPEGKFEGQFRLFLETSQKDIQTMEMIKQLAVNEKAKNAISFPQLIKIFRLDTLNEMEVAIEKYEREFQQLQQQNFQLQEQAKTKSAQEVEAMKFQLNAKLEELKIQLSAPMEQRKLDLEQMAVDIKKAIADWDKERFMLEMSLKEEDLLVKNKKVDVDSSVEKANIATEREVELAYLDEDARQFNISVGLDARQQDIDKDQQKLDEKKMKHDEKKMEFQKEKAKTEVGTSKGKERIKN